MACLQRARILLAARDCPLDAGKRRIDAFDHCSDRTLFHALSLA
jgi:hypothetical protein